MTIQQQLSRYSNWLIITTSAYIYNTPERLHVLAISIPVIALTLFFDYLFKKQPEPRSKLLVGLYGAVILIPSLVLIGILEGVYNHIFKNLLFFSNVPEDIIKKVFFGFYDPALVEMPNDIIFELTGMLQGILTIPLAKLFIRYVSAKRS